MKLLTSLYLFLSLITLPAFAAVDNAEAAPDFTLASDSGKLVKLSSFKGKVVVLEWLNHGCPFVRKHYDANNMQKIQKAYTDKGVVWLSIISSAPGKQGHVDVAGAMKDKKANKSKATHVLLDPSGEVGKKYGAKTTPHMYVINKEGKIAYQGAIDSIPSASQDDIPKAENYVVQALDFLLDGKKKRLAMAKTKPYGCSVKY